MRILLGVLVIAALGIALYLRGGSTESNEEAAGPVEKDESDDGFKIERS
jgi:hypothetical protein